MGQLGPLTWKNFQFVRRHPIKALLMVLLPIFCLGFLALIIQFSDIQNVGDCDHETIALPSSKNSPLLGSLGCQKLDKCKDADTYRDPHEINEGMMDDPRYFNESCSFMKDVVMMNITKRESYTKASLMDFIFNAKILYYNGSSSVSSVEMKAVIDKMVEILDASFLSLKPPNTSAGGPPPPTSMTNGSLPFPGNGGPPNIVMMMYGAAKSYYIPLNERIFEFNNQDDALNYAQENDLESVKDGLIWGMIEMKDLGKLSKYKIVSHFNLRNRESSLYLQSLVEAALIQVKTGESEYPQLMYKLMPERCHKDPEVYDPAFSAIGFALCFGLMMFAYTIASEICYEKAAGLIEFLMIAGVARWKLKLSWFIYGLPYVLVIGFAMSAIIKFIDSKLIEHTPFTLLLIFLVLYCLSLLCLCFCVASMLSTPQRAGLVMFTTLLAANLAPQWGDLVPEVGYEGGTLIFVRALCFMHSTFAAQIGMAYIISLEKINKGVTWGELGASPDPTDQFGGVKEILFYFVLQCFIYMFLSWYFDHTAPSKYGLKWPVYFCCMPSYWRCSSNTEDDGGEDQIKSDMEPPPQGKEVGIQIHNLNKSYGKGKKAVDHLTVPFYKNEITALLGHNGAGKSTTMNMLTGMIGPTSGTAVIDGYDIKNQMDNVRQKLGFCPQYDIIYPELSVKDHMKFYGDLKGLKRNDVMSYAMEIFKHMNMLDAMDRPAMNLSGGMKRKLSIAISFLGDPTTLILDEPTSAIDPFSRRAIWDTILQYRSKSTILVSTHYMQEADVLGDRIAIIDQGQLKCFGSPMYLKSRYGTGSKILLAHHKEIQAQELCQELQSFCPITLLNKSKTETTLGASIETARSPKMIDCFAYLEKNKEVLGIESFGIAESTMEQVFFTVAEGGGTPHHDHDNSQSSKLLKPEDQSDSGCSLFWNQFLATWIKRFHLGRKSIIALVFQVLAPMLFMVILWVISRNFASIGVGGDTQLVHLWNFTKSHKLFYSGDVDSSLAEALENWSLGTRCLNVLDNLTCSNSQTQISTASIFSGMGPTCNCSECNGYGGDPVIWDTLVSGDNITNLDRNISDFLLKIDDQKLMGGIEVIELDNGIINILWAGQPIRRGRRPTEDELQQRSMKSSFVNAYNNLLLRSRTPAAESPGEYGIQLESEEQSFRVNEISGIQAVNGILLGFFGSLALMMPVFTVLLFLVTENSSGNKQLQLLMGMSSVVYWIANFIWDIIIYFISALLMCGFMAIFPDTFDIQIEYFLMIALMYGANMILMSYVITFLINTSRMAILIMGMTAPFFSMACLILLSWSQEDWYPQTIFGMNFIPPCFITDSLMVMEFNKLMPEPMREELLTWDKLNKRFAIAGLFSLTMFMLLILLQSGLLKFESIKNALCCVCCEPNKVDNVDYNQHIDPDVKAEEERVLSNESARTNDVLRVKSLTKTYTGGKTAVKGVSVGVHSGECFGLLGVNGAGKTTMFQMLTGYHAATSGEALLMGHSIFDNQSKVAKHMSYCPQQDVIFESLTPTEHLNLYSRIRGISSDDRSKIIPNLMEEIGLAQHKSKQSHALSGGNKRKLNFAISMLGFPDVIFLDEMTTGMDPKARRAAWNVLETGIRSGSAAIITSHSMEECESLCQRLVIMVNGKFKCIGGVQYLKDKYGNNYNVKFKLGPTGDPENVLKMMQDTFTQARLVEQHLGYVEVEIPASTLTLSHLFQTIHDMKEQVDMEDFSVSQTTLEHVFVNMVREQE